MCVNTHTRTNTQAPSPAPASRRFHGEAPVTRDVTYESGECLHAYGGGAGSCWLRDVCVISTAAHLGHKVNFPLCSEKKKERKNQVRFTLEWPGSGGGGGSGGKRQGPIVSCRSLHREIERIRDSSLLVYSITVGFLLLLQGKHLYFKSFLQYISKMCNPASVPVQRAGSTVREIISLLANLGADRSRA